MRIPLRALIVAWLALASALPLQAAEGPTIAGPIGGTDIRSAQLPPPGLYGGIILLASPAFDFVDGNSNTIPALSKARLTKYFNGPFLVYVPDITVLGGSIGVAGIIPNGAICGRLFAHERTRCNVGIGDPYFELMWSRSFGRLRPSEYPDAFPIHEGLTIAVGVGVVLPLGQFDSADVTTQSLSIGTNIFDIAPSVAFTYTTPPLLAEGTEFSAKLYWNEYLPNPTTHYSTGSIVSVDFAVTERIGPLQIGLAGNYLVQVEDDKLFSARVPPDGKRAEGLSLGGVANFDLPKQNASVKVKTLSTVFAKNNVRFWGLSLGWAKKLF